MIQGFELTEAYVQFFDEAATWEEAVHSLLHWKGP